MTVTIQRTAKKFKALIFVANLIQIIGVIAFIAAIGRETSVEPALWALGVGIGLHAAARALIWWNHG